MKYILNSLIVPLARDVRAAQVLIEKVPVEKAKEFVDDSFVSAVGHEATAKLLTELLGADIPLNRVAIEMRPGDQALHFVLRQRLPEGTVLNIEALKTLEFDFYITTVKKEV